MHCLQRFKAVRPNIGAANLEHVIEWTLILNVSNQLTSQLHQLVQLHTTDHHRYQHPFNGLVFHDNLGKTAAERLNQSESNEARDDGVAVASAGPYVNHLHLAADR